MNDEQFAIFQDALDQLSAQYPNRHLEMSWDVDRWVISVDGKVKFTTSGYNFLYCLTRLVKCIEDELL